VPYGWQFPDEEVCTLSEKAYQTDCLELINRQSRCHWQAMEQNMDAQSILEYLENFSFEIHKETFMVLDNARRHKFKIICGKNSLIGSKGVYSYFSSCLIPRT
jgi:NADH pyrophosphatase NudC (nudix superfamily)